MTEEEAPPARKCNHGWGMIEAGPSDSFWQPCMTPGCGARRWVTVQVKYVLEVQE